MMFLRNVLFCLSGVSLQRYHSADFGLIKKTLFHTGHYTGGPTADDIQDNAIVPAAAVISFTVW